MSFELEEIRDNDLFSSDACLLETLVSYV